MRRVYELLGVLLPDVVSNYFKENDIWLVPHRFSFLRKHGRLAEATTVGVDVEYDDCGMTCSIVNLLPTWEQVNHANLGLSGVIGFDGEIAAAEASFPEEADQVNADGLRLAINARARARAGLAFQFNGSVVTPRIAAVGEGDCRCSWKFQKHQAVLFDRDIATWAAVTLSRRRDAAGKDVRFQMKYKMRFWMVYRTLVWPSRCESGWADLTCDMEPNFPWPVIRPTR